MCDKKPGYGLYSKIWLDNSEQEEDIRSVLMPQAIDRTPTMQKKASVEILYDVPVLSSQNRCFELYAERLCKRENCEDGVHEGLGTEDETGKIVKCSPAQDYLR